MKQKCIVLFSGGLDSRLAVKIMQEKNFEILVVHFKLPFGCGGLIESVKKFCEEQKVELKIFDCTRGKLLREYLEVIKKAKFGRGAGFNPCIDCKIFMLMKVKKFADEKKIKFIATGEVEGQRPMSQTKSKIKFIEEKSELNERILRPVNEIARGRRRENQIVLAEKFEIDYPSPAGGCVLCERELKRRFEILINNNLINEKSLPLVLIGRHFWKDACWFVVGRSEKENIVIERFKDCIKSKKGKPAVFYSEQNCEKFAEELQEDYKTGGNKKYSAEKI